MASVTKINGYDIKDKTARSTIDNLSGKVTALENESGLVDGNSGTYVFDLVLTSDAGMLPETYRSVETAKKIQSIYISELDMTFSSPKCLGNEAIIFTFTKNNTKEKKLVNRELAINLLTFNYTVQDNFEIFADGSVTPEKTNFIGNGNNLFDKSKATIVGYYAYNSGLYNSESTGNRSTDFIEVEPNTSYWINVAWTHITYWNANKEYVGGATSDSSNNFNFTTNENTKYLIVSINVNNVNSCMLNSGEKLLPYEEYSYVLDKNIKLPNNFVNVNNLDTNLQEDIKNAKDRFIPTLELGNIAIGDGWWYSDSTTRVRTPQGYTISLSVGDTIKLIDYSNAKYYLGWLTKNGEYKNSNGWLTTDFIATEEGEYVILLCNTTDTTQSNVNDLGDLLRIYRSNYNNNQAGLVSDNTKKIIHITNENIKSIAHRGYSNIAPENTLSAYKAAKQKGFKYVECDVSFTSDNVPVLLHDDTIDRTSNGTGNIYDLTYEYVRTLDFGSWFSNTYVGELIPSFEEFISLCKNLGLHPYIEIKVAISYTEAQIKSLVDIVKKYGMKDNVTWISFSNVYLGYVKTYLPKARLGYIVYEVTDNEIANANALKNDTNEVFIDQYYIHTTDEVVSKLIENDLPLETYIVDTSEVLLSLNNYVSGITSNTLIASEVLYYN